jgi:ankyrin repeat protein
MGEDAAAAPTSELPSTSNAAALEGAGRWLQLAADTSTGAVLSDVDMLRRALALAQDKAFAERRKAWDQEEAERIRNEPTKERKKELKWDLFNKVWQAGAQGGAEDVVAILKTRGSDPNGKNAIGSTPLHRAAQLGNLGVARALMAEGADPTLPDDQDQTPADVARHNNHPLLHALLQKYVDDKVEEENRKGGDERGDAVAAKASG